MHVIAAKAVSFKEALSDEFKTYQQQIVKNAAALANGLLKRGINLVSGGTDNHLMLVDLRNLNLTGKEAQHILDEVNITCNKNGIPYDPQSPFITSGLRIGTPAVTTRGFKEAEMKKIIKEGAEITRFELPRAEAIKFMEEKGERTEFVIVGCDRALDGHDITGSADVVHL